MAKNSLVMTKWDRQNDPIINKDEHASQYEMFFDNIRHVRRKYQKRSQFSKKFLEPMHPIFP